MDSAPRPSPEADAPLRGVAGVAGGLRAHRSPLGGAASAARRLSGVGDVGRAAMRFGALTFLSQSARRHELARDAGSGYLSVRPPDYWSGQHRHADELADGSRQVQRTGDAGFDALIARRR